MPAELKAVEFPDLVLVKGPAGIFDAVPADKGTFDIAFLLQPVKRLNQQAIIDPSLLFGRLLF